MIAVITPWRNAANLLPAWERATEGAIPIIIDNGCDKATRYTLDIVTHARGGIVLEHHAQPFSYAAACNQGIRFACGLKASHVVCLNNDIEGAADWLDDVARLPGGVLAGPEMGMDTSAGRPLAYVAGWCVAATLATWAHIGLWDAETYQGSYHEDVDLSWRAARAGVSLQRRPWVLKHLGNTTSKVTPGAYDHHAANRAAFRRRVEGAKQ
jgi:GT2 family glycosyltransferase